MIIYLQKKYWIVTIPWTILLVFVYSNFVQMSSSPAFGFSDPLFWVGIVNVIWVGLISGIGFVGVGTTILSIREIVKGQIKIEPLHVDRLGGLSAVGYYAIGTTLLFSSGSLFLALGVEFTMLSRGHVDTFLAFTSSFYLLFILLSFLFYRLR